MLKGLRKTTVSARPECKLVTFGLYISFVMPIGDPKPGGLTVDPHIEW